MEFSTDSTLQVHIETPDLGPKPDSLSSSPITHIGILFTSQKRRSSFYIAEDGTQTVDYERESPRVPLCDHHFPVEIFNHGDDSLSLHLSFCFKRFDEEINAGIVADEIIRHWIQIRDEVIASSSERVFSLIVNLVCCKIHRYREIAVAGDSGMIPACGGVVEMLERVKIDYDCCDEICVICFEKFGENALRMPCLHLFHGDCIGKWLKKSHYCPICRFQMPTDEFSS